MHTPNPMFLELEHIPLKIGRMVIEPPPDKSPMFLIYNIIIKYLHEVIFP